MTNRFIYSILKYRHSQVTGETLNVGVLFAFEAEGEYHFITGNPQRAKAIYPEFDTSYFNLIAKNIRNKLSQREESQLFRETPFLKEYINLVLLPEDSSTLQFSELYTAINSMGSVQKATEEFTRILLPAIESRKEETRHNENFILKKYTDSISRRNINIDRRMTKNKLIQIKGVKLNFELAWKNGIYHFVKPLSFDLKEEREILNKSATYFGYLNLLADYAKRNEYQFDLLIAKPQDEKLLSSYDDALYNLDLSPAPKDLITEEKFEDYTDETVNYLHTKDL